VVSALIPRRDASLVVVTEKGHAKRVPFTEVKRQGRAGKGVAILPERAAAGDLVAVLEAHPGDRIVLEVSSGETIPVETDSIREKARRGASVRIQAFAARPGQVTAVHPLRSGSVGAPARDGGASPVEDAPSTEGPEPVVFGPGQVELELEGN